MAPIVVLIMSHVARVGHLRDSEVDWLEHHHHDTIHEYVDPETAEVNRQIVTREPEPDHRMSNKLTWCERPRPPKRKW